jgi:hypothetical protein
MIACGARAKAIVARPVGAAVHDGTCIVSHIVSSRLRLLMLSKHEERSGGNKREQSQ